MLLITANKPGYLPEGEPQEASTLKEAQAALIKAIEATAEIVGDWQGGNAYLEAIKCANSARLNDSVMYCGYAHTISLEEGALWLEPFAYVLSCTVSAMQYEAREQEYLQEPLKEITEETFYDMLEQLPPLRWKSEEGMQTFCCCEMTIGNITRQYIKAGNRFFTRYVDILKSETLKLDKVREFISNG